MKVAFLPFKNPIQLKTLLAWPYNKPFCDPNSNILALFGLTVHWAHSPALFGNINMQVEG